MSSDADADADTETETDQRHSGAGPWSDERWDTFYTTSFGRDADEAFHDAIERVKWACDKTSVGTIWEKEEQGFVVIPEKEHTDQQKSQYAQQLIENGDERVGTVEAPAGAISLAGTPQAREYRESNDLTDERGTVWLFFGVGTEPRRDVSLTGTPPSANE